MVDCMGRLLCRVPFRHNAADINGLLGWFLNNPAKS